MTEKPLAQIREEKIRKLEELRKLGMDPFVHKKFGRSHKIGELAEKFSKIKPDEKLSGEKVSVAGRIRSISSHGKGGFADIEDVTGKIQLWITIDGIGEKSYSVFEKMDISDIAGVNGYIFKTKKGELSVCAESFTLLAK